MTNDGERSTPRNLGESSPLWAMPGRVGRGRRERESHSSARVGPGPKASPVGFQGAKVSESKVANVELPDLAAGLPAESAGFADNSGFAASTPFTNDAVSAGKPAAN